MAGVRIISLLRFLVVIDIVVYENICLIRVPSQILHEGREWNARNLFVEF